MTPQRKNNHKNVPPPPENSGFMGTDTLKDHTIKHTELSTVLFSEDFALLSIHTSKTDTPNYNMKQNKHSRFLFFILDSETVIDAIRVL